MSCTGELHSPHNFVEDVAVDDDQPIVFVIGAMAKGHVTTEGENHFIESMMSLSEYPLSGATAINRLLGAFERHWGIV